jgi:hypothetical protein
MDSSCTALRTGAIKMLIFAEGYDDYATESDLSLSAAAVTNCSVIAGRGGNGFAAQFGSGGRGTLVYNVPASAASNVYAGFAVEALSGTDPLNFISIQFQAGGQPLFSIVQASAAGLLFFDASNALTPSPYSYATDLLTGLIGSATYKNWGSYVEVHLTPGNPGHVTVLIDGVQALSVTGLFSGQVGTTMLTPTLTTGQTSIQVMTDLGQTAPFVASITSAPGHATSPILVTATGGFANTTWTIAPYTGLTEYATSLISVYDQVGTVDGLVCSTQSGGSVTALGAIDDLYMCDTTGAHNNSFMGNTRIISGPPSGDGAAQQWTPSSGTAHWPLVDAYPINYGATNVQAAATGLNDSYTWPALPGLGAFGTLRALQVVVYCEALTGGGTNQISPLVYIAGTPYYAPSVPTPAVWQAVAGIFETNPATGDPWTAAAINAAQPGQQNVGVD